MDADQAPKGASVAEDADQSPSTTAQENITHSTDKEAEDSSFLHTVESALPCCPHCHPQGSCPLLDFESVPADEFESAAFTNLRSSTPISFPPVQFVSGGDVSPSISAFDQSATEQELDANSSFLDASVTTVCDDDPSYEPSEEMDVSLAESCTTADEDCTPDPTHPVSDRKFVVFESQLDQLLARCQSCGQVVEEKEKKVTGSLLSVTCHCLNGHTTVWDSQPTYGRGMFKTGIGNILIAAAILFSGGVYSTFSLWASLLNLSFIGRSTFFHIQSTILCPVVNYVWLLQVEAIHFLCKGRKVKLSGDGRCDSPGYSAKFGE